MQQRQTRDDDAVMAAQSQNTFNRFAAENRGFILRCASRAAGRFIGTSDEEYAVSLEAFYEAVMSYSREKGSFNAFAALIIRRRLIDELNRRRRRRAEIPIGSALDWEDEESAASGLMPEVQKKIAEKSLARTHSARDEIDALRETLGRYGFVFFDLAEDSPRAAKTKEACAKVVRCLLNEPLLMELMRAKRRLPVSEIKKRTGVSDKLFERHRKYLIAAAEILAGDYPRLQEYLKYIKKGN